MDSTAESGLNATVQSNTQTTVERAHGGDPDSDGGDLAQPDEGDVREDTSETTHRGEGEQTDRDAALTQDSTRTGDKSPWTTASDQDKGSLTQRKEDDGSERKSVKRKRCRKVLRPTSGQGVSDEAGCRGRLPSSRGRCNAEAFPNLLFAVWDYYKSVYV